MTDLEAIAARHKPDDDMTSARPYCVACELAWPCDASLLLAEVERLIAALAITDENRYNERDRAERAEAQVAALSERVGVLEGALREILGEPSLRPRIRTRARAALAPTEREAEQPSRRDIALLGGDPSL